MVVRFLFTFTTFFLFYFFFFNDPATTEIYTLSLHDALPILSKPPCLLPSQPQQQRDNRCRNCPAAAEFLDRKSTRLNSSHVSISYAVFCLKKKNNINSEFRNYI